MKNKKYLWLLCLIPIIILAVVIIFLMNDKNKDDEEQKEGTSTNVVLRDDGTARFVGGEEVKSKVTDNDDVYVALNSIKNYYGFSDAKSEFSVISVDEASGFKYYKVNQEYKGIKVYGKQLVLAVDQNNEVQSVTGGYYKDLSINTYGGLGIDKAVAKLDNVFEKDSYKVITKDRYIYTDLEEPLMVYIYDVMTEDGMFVVILDAFKGDVIKKIETDKPVAFEYTGTGSNNKEYTVTIDKLTSVYNIYDPDRKIKIIDASDTAMDFGSEKDRKWLNLLYFALIHDKKINYPISAMMFDDKLEYRDLSTGIVKNDILAAAYPTLYNFEKTYDYYYNVLGRNSFDNKGAEIVANIGLRDELFTWPWQTNEYQNASWMGGLEEFYFGSKNGIPYSVALDIVAHEFQHAVTDYTAGLIYYGESGALNEAYSDIMGSLVEGKNFAVGEDFTEMRNMADPEKFEDPAIKDGKYYFPTDTETYNDEWKETIMKRYEEAGSPLSSWEEWDNGGVHNNSGVPNHAAYLMYKNGAFSSMEEMAKVWYNSLFLLTSSADFEDCALAVIQSARMLGLKQDKVKIIEDAFVETKMLDYDYQKVTGNVIDSETEEPLSNVQVTLISDLNIYVNYSTYTDSDGNFSFVEIPVGDYTITYEKSKYAYKEEKVKVDKEQKLTAKLTKVDDSEYSDAEIIFVLDISLSMDTSDPEDIRKQMMVNVISSLPDEADVALVTFANNAQVINSGLSNKKIDKKMLMTDVFNIANDSGNTDNSGTNGRAGLTQALDLFTDRKDSRKYIIFFTDGVDNRESGLTYEEIIEESNNKNIRILSVGLGLGSDLNEEVLKELALQTNGKYYHAADFNDLREFDQSIFDELK